MRSSVSKAQVVSKGPHFKALRPKCKGGRGRRQNMPEAKIFRLIVPFVLYLSNPDELVVRLQGAIKGNKHRC